MTLSSTAFAISASSSLKPRNYGLNSASSSIYSLNRFPSSNTLNARPWISRYVISYFLQFLVSFGKFWIRLYLRFASISISISIKPMYWNLVQVSGFFTLTFAFCRKLYRVRATLLQDNEEKVVVEESFEPNTSVEDKVKGISGEPADSSSSSTLERWVIKLEQSVNIFLTVNSIPVCYLLPKLP